MQSDHQTDAPPAHVQLIQMATGAWVARTLHAAATLGLADQLAGGPKSATELARPMRVHAPSLHRLMRTLASLGILAENTERRYALTTLGAALKTNAPGAARSTMLALGSPWAQSAWDHLVYCVQTGKTGFEKAQGMPLFDYLARHPEDASLFNETIVGFHGQEPPAIATAYDFSTFNTIVDIGGGTGNLLAAILSRYVGLRGVLFDLPHVLAEAPALLRAKGVSDRVTIEAGDFFKSVPAGGDAYVLSHIIHDWDEDQCLTILAHIRKVMNSAGRLLIAEMVLPAGDEPHPGKMLDMAMLVWPGGQERTLVEYDHLLSKAGFHLTRVVPTNSAVNIVEAVLTRAN
jgi:O-methyltransferase domain/Dimerisation domain